MHDNLIISIHGLHIVQHNSPKMDKRYVITLRQMVTQLHAYV